MGAESAYYPPVLVVLSRVAGLHAPPIGLGENGAGNHHASEENAATSLTDYDSGYSCSATAMDAKYATATAMTVPSNQCDGRLMNMRIRL
jgi:hypothetical protein